MSQREKAHLATDIDKFLKQQNTELQQQLAQLQSHPEADERTARERLLLDAARRNHLPFPVRP